MLKRVIWGGLLAPFLFGIPSAHSTGGCIVPIYLESLNRISSNPENTVFFGYVTGKLDFTDSTDSENPKGTRKFSVRVVKTISGSNIDSIIVTGFEFNGSDKEYQKELWRYFYPNNNERWYISNPSKLKRNGVPLCDLYPKLRVDETYLFIEDKEYGNVLNYPIPTPDEM
jgi:hypothetical protein